MNPGKPRHIKEAQGTLRKCREPENPLSWEPVEKFPDMEAASEHAKWYYDHVCGCLRDAGLLARAYLPAIQRAAFWYGLYGDARERMARHNYYQETPNGYSQVSAFFTVAEKAHRYLTEFEKSFGLDLVSSQKIEMPKKDSESQYFD